MGVVTKFLSKSVGPFLDRIALNPSHSFAYGESDDADNQNLQPMVSGYMYVLFLLPDTVYRMLTNYLDSAILTIQCTAVELPDITINAVERRGFGGSRQIIPASVDHGNSFNIRFYETARADIINIMKIWHGGIFNNNTGMMRLPPNKKEYAGKALLVVSNQEMAFYNIRYAILFNGVWPMTLPQSALNPDISNNSIVELSFQFAFDAMQDVREFFAKKGLKAAKSLISKFKK